MPLGSLNPLGDSFPGLCLPSGQSSCLFPHRPQVDLSQDPPLRCACTPQPRWSSKWRLLGGARLIMAWNYPLTFDPSEPFCAYVMSPLSPKGGDGDLLILYSNRVLSLFVLAMGCMKHKLESRLPGEISIASDMQMTQPLWQKAKN